MQAIRLKKICYVFSFEFFQSTTNQVSQNYLACRSCSIFSVSNLWLICTHTAYIFSEYFLLLSCTGWHFFILLRTCIINSICVSTPCWIPSYACRLLLPCRSFRLPLIYVDLFYFPIYLRLLLAEISAVKFLLPSDVFS